MEFVSDSLGRFPGFEVEVTQVPCVRNGDDDLPTLFYPGDGYGAPSSPVVTSRPPFNPGPGYSLPHPVAGPEPVIPASPAVVVTSRPPFVPPLQPFPPGSIDSYGAPLAPAVTSRSVN